MKQDFFKNLPPDIIISILSRLPLRAIAISKCVCKSWLDLLETDYFVDSHLAKSISTLAALMSDEKSDSNWCRVFELEGELDRRYNLLTKFEFPHRATIEGSANGLLLLQKLGPLPNTLYVCNPITRDYAEICCSEVEIMSYYRFGVSKISGQYKVVAINSKSECRVYTLGTESWRLVEASASGNYEGFIFAAFVNGSLFWTKTESSNNHLITCFDLETECFSSFCAPASCREFFVIKDCLCFCEWEEDKIVIWLMLDNGVEKSWRKEYVMSQGRCVDGFYYSLVYAIKVFGNGDILMLWDVEFPFCYFNETKTVEEIVGLFDAPSDFINWVLLTPSFLSLEGLGMKNVISF